MALSSAQAIEALHKMLAFRDHEMKRLDVIQGYLRDDPESRDIAGLPVGTPADVVRLARLSRVNLLKYIVSARVQNMYVDGFRTPTSPDDLAVWQVWQANGMDARQIGVHRAALSFGASYVLALPGMRNGEPMPVLRGFSPRQLTVAYGEDDEWPKFALHRVAEGVYRLIDETSVYRITAAKDSSDSKAWDVAEPESHDMTWNGLPVCPVVRYRETDDLDDPCRGIVEPYFPLQDQVNITTFGLQVAQHYGAFRQRYIIGWMAENSSEALRASASRLMQFEDSPDDVSVGEFAQTDMRGYIESREATIRHLATVSQTPVHELLGQFINLSAEALEAARASHAAGVDENRIVCGESHEQLLNLVSEAIGVEPDPAATVIWRDTRVRSLREAAEALGMLVEKLGVPPRALWHRVPGVPQHEIARWEAIAAEGDAFADLTRMLDGQASPAPSTAPPVPVA